ncbi:MAG: LUD domain-containing protein [Caldilineaceae bacterium]
MITKLLEWAEDEANARKGAQLETHQERMVLCWDAAALPVPAIREALTDMRFALITPSDLAGAEARDRIRYIRFGVTGVEAAFATTASMLMTTSAQTNRVASLLPLRHIALIPFSRLYPTSEDWLRAQRTADNLVDLYRQHANLTMISGPSKSADIEMNLTLGVHGPKFVHAILFDNQEG